MTPAPPPVSALATGKQKGVTFSASDRVGMRDGMDTSQSRVAGTARMLGAEKVSRRKALVGGPIRSNVSQARRVSSEDGEHTHGAHQYFSPLIASLLMETTAVRGACATRDTSRDASRLHSTPPKPVTRPLNPPESSDNVRTHLESPSQPFQHKILSGSRRSIYGVFVQALFIRTQHNVLQCGAFKRSFFSWNQNDICSPGRMFCEVLRHRRHLPRRKFRTYDGGETDGPLCCTPISHAFVSCHSPRRGVLRQAHVLAAVDAPFSLYDPESSTQRPLWNK